MHAFADLYNEATDAIEAGMVDRLREVLLTYHPLPSSFSSRHEKEEKGTEPEDFINTYSNEDGDRLLHWACLESQTAIARVLIEEFQASVDVHNREGLTPLHCAASIGALDLVAYLARNCCANVEAVDQKGQTPIFAACVGGHLKVVQYLVQVCQVHVEHVDTLDQATPFLYTLATLQSDTIDEIRHLTLIRYLVERAQVNVRHCDKHGRNGLLWAADLGQAAVPMAHYLLQQDTKLSQADETGFTPLLRAIDFGNCDMIQCLLEYSHEDVLEEHGSYASPFLFAFDKQDWTAIYLMVRYRPVVWHKFLLLGVKTQVFLNHVTGVQSQADGLHQLLTEEGVSEDDTMTRLEAYRNCLPLQQQVETLQTQVPVYVQQVRKMKVTIDHSLGLRKAAEIQRVTKAMEHSLLQMQEANQYLLLSGDNLPFSNAQLLQTSQNLERLLQRLEECRQELVP